MKVTTWTVLLTACLLTLAIEFPAIAHSEVFSDYSFKEAKKIANEKGVPLIVDFTASWCPPCKKMEKTTWSDSEVKDWIKNNAIAIQIDVDKNQRVTSALNVKAMPTLILFTPESGSKEFSRQVGYMDSSALLVWLGAVKAGKSQAAVKQEMAGADPNTVWNHVAKAQEFRAANKNAEALTEYLWLWENIKGSDPGLNQMKKNVVPHELKRLVKVHPPAKAKIVALRDGSNTKTKRQDWIILNAILDDNARTLAWFDKAKIDPSKQGEITSSTNQLERILFSTRRWSDAAQYLYPDPVKKINQYYKSAQKMKQPGPNTEVAKGFDPFPSMVTLIYGAYIGANREEEAKKIADECLRLDDTADMRKVLANMAKSMRQARKATK